MTWAGVTIALVGALGYALGAALQQFEAVTEGASLKLMRRPRWWIGGIIGFTGASLHAVALSLAPPGRRAADQRGDAGVRGAAGGDAARQAAAPGGDPGGRSRWPSACSG
ncbi:hypothetical protein GCM10018953_25580 [Streptosporangium nondiastaticum]|uniref:hypothetical protein n=1 Tax=Streptosporangium nondiastaticum TaxID=35764 RepID=UPI0031F935E6